MFKKNQARVLVQAVCYHCGRYNEYYKHPDEPSVCQYCGFLFEVGG